MITLIRWRPAWCLDFPLTFPLSPAKISPSSPMIPIVSITFSQAGYFHFIISLSLSASTLNQMFLSIQGGAWHVADALLVLSLGQVVLPLIFRPLSWLLVCSAFSSSCSPLWTPFWSSWQRGLRQKKSLLTKGEARVSHLCNRHEKFAQNNRKKYFSEIKLTVIKCWPNYCFHGNSRVEQSILPFFHCAAWALNTKYGTKQPTIV